MILMLTQAAFSKWSDLPHISLNPCFLKCDNMLISLTREHLGSHQIIPNISQAEAGQPYFRASLPLFNIPSRSIWYRLCPACPRSGKGSPLLGRQAPRTDLVVAGRQHPRTGWEEAHRRGLAVGPQHTGLVHPHKDFRGLARTRLSRIVRTGSGRTLEPPELQVARPTARACQI